MVRLFVFARHAESAANAANVLSSDPSGSVTLTPRGRAQARALGAQLANLHIDLAVGTRLLRTRQTIDIALGGREVPVLIEPDFDELRVGDLEGAPIEPLPGRRPFPGRHRRMRFRICSTGAPLGVQRTAWTRRSRPPRPQLLTAGRTR